MQGWVIAVAAIAYVTLLFAIASWGDRAAARNGQARARPYVYALSLAVYCTSWTFFGSVGLAAERGPEFLAIYVGPILVFVFGYPLLSRIIHLAKSQNITSIADFLAARYGKSFAVAALATMIATFGTVPYIALQLKAISGSVSLMAAHYGGGAEAAGSAFGDVSLAVALLLALFAILFGTRHADATEHQDGLILAVAVESIVKLAAFLAVGLAVAFFLLGGPGELAAVAGADARVAAAWGHRTPLTTWIVMTVLSAVAILMLPRQFHVTVVENRSRGELRKACWLFPLYLVAINLFVLPIAFAGLATLGPEADADLYVVSLPLSFGQDALALFAFIGGLSAATAMVIVACVALSIMISNDLVLPLFVRGLVRPGRRAGEDWSKLILNIRRAAIVLLLFAAFLYYRETTSNTRLAAIGLISFAAIAQFSPAFIGGLVWRGANARGAVLGMGAGIAVWAYTLLFPSLAPPDTAILLNGPFGLAALRPQALFGMQAAPLDHGVIWSLSLNTLFFVLGSLSRGSMPLERIQAALFVPREAGPVPSLRRFRTAVTVDDLKDTISRYLGAERTERAFQDFAQTQGRPVPGGAPAGMAVTRFSEQLLASAVGSSSARLILSLLFQRRDANPRGALRLLDEATEALQQNRDLLQTALDQMEEGVTVLDRDFRLTCWNRQFRTLLELPDEMAGVGVSLHHVLDFLVERGDLADGAQTLALNRMTWFGDVWRMELARSGRVVEVRTNAMPDGGIVASYTDVTARMAAEQALRRANETLEQRVVSRTAELTRVNEELAMAQMLAEEANLGKTRFLAAAGHDILQPLNAARLYCSALMESTGREASAGALANIESALESVETILGAVLDISRLDTGEMKPSPSLFRLDAFLRQIATDFQPLAAEKGLELRVVASSLAVRTDRNLLRRLVQNLVSNAIKYTREGKVLVGVRRRGKFVEIQVRDTGIGIEEAELNAVFREFNRLKEGAREAEGLGLGLSIVDRIARVLRLEIQLQSRKGRGTRFSVILQRETAAPAETGPEAGTPADRLGRHLRGARVLCIDNEPRILDGMRMLLEAWGCEVITAPDAEAFLARLPPPPCPDIVLADYHLDGGENGLQAISQLRDACAADMACILVTADRSGEVRKAAAAMDVAVLGKPVKPAGLRAILAGHRKTAPGARGS